MNALDAPVAGPFDRRDLLLEEAFLQATDNTIVVPNVLQRALFPRLSTQDTGLLVQTGPGAGRLEAVFVPVMASNQADDGLHRLYIIIADNALLDDFHYRLIPYVRSLAASRSIPITVFFDEPEPFCRQYASDGSYIDDLCRHPLDARVDLVVAHYSAFRSLFFGSGGVHALPGSLEPVDDLSTNFESRRRDLFYFDEVQNYDVGEFVGFVKLVEFLYAEDLDVLVGATTLPEPCIEELSFLENLSLDMSTYQPPRSIVTIQAKPDQELEIIVNLIKDRYFESSRAGVVRATPEDVDVCFDRLTLLYPQLVFRYHSGQTRAERMKTYALLRELEKEGEGYLLVCDGRAIESSDLDVNLMITSICAPERLILRAGRCNRRGDLANGEIIVVGDNYRDRLLPDIRKEAYLDAIAACSDRKVFSPSSWKAFIT